MLTGLQMLTCSALLTGCVSCWHAAAHICFEDSKTHRTRVSTLVWSTRQAALASGDDTGRIALWRLEAAANLSLLMQFDAAAQGSISHIVFAQESGVPAACSLLSAQNSYFASTNLSFTTNCIQACSPVYLHADQLSNNV